MRVTRRDHNIPSRGRCAFVITLLAPLFFAAQAQAEVLISRYAVNLAGIHVGEAIVHTTLDAKHYKVEISADVGTLLNNTKVQGEASGLRTGAKLTPEHFRLVTSDGKESAVDFTAGKDPKASSQLRGVLDPLSALLAASLRPSSATAAPCDKVFPVIMSRVRFDASLHPVMGEEQRDPRLTTCRVRFTGGAGSQGLQNVQWEVNFQKLAKPQFWLVEQLSLPTDMGIVTIERVQTSVSAS